METVPQKVLNWLHSVLLNGYRDVNRTYQDVGHTLGRYSYIRPSTEIYTFDDGRSALLLHLSGTVPASFRGVTYSFPVSIWVPQEYPAWPPITFVTAAQDMAIRPGQHVGVEGKVYHPYLSNWHPDRSNIVGLVQVLGDIFSREPPLVGRQQQQQQQALPAPLHPRLGQATLSGTPNPPALPPKPGQQQQQPSRQQALPVRSSSLVGQQGPPPRPPKGDEGTVSQLALGQTRHQSIASPPPPQQPPRPGSISLGRGPQSSTLQQASHQQSQQWELPHHQKQQQHPSQQYRTAPSIPQHQQLSSHHSGPLSPPPPLPPQQPQQQIQAYQNWQQQVPPAQPVPQPRKPEPQDLLTSPFDLPLPNPSNLPVPPVPPNPEKDAILHAISSSLNTQLQQIIQSNAAALLSLQAQHVALANAHNNLQQEFAHLRALEAQVQANEATLRSSLKEADDSIADAKQRPVPNIDETLIAPTVLSNQIYNLVAEEKSCNAARQILLKGLDNGRLGVTQWNKYSRSVAREEWLKKWLIKRGAKGMGLHGVESETFAGETGVAAGGDDASFYR